MYRAIFFQDYQKEVGENRLQIEYIQNHRHTFYDNIEEEVLSSVVKHASMYNVACERCDQKSF
jgi:hypothetical protein